MKRTEDILLVIAVSLIVGIMVFIGVAGIGESDPVPATTSVPTAPSE